ncbi:MAG: hypothetical protein ACRDIB_17290 [Ardenticatenaceae bacterium]
MRAYIILLAAGMLALFGLALRPAYPAGAERVESVFVDVNGDGLTDFLIAGRAVLQGAEAPGALPTAPPEPAGVRLARLSHYWPPLGGPNCARFIAGKCASRMASGERWEDWIGRAAACPPEVPFWTTVILPGGERFVCLDRGSRIITEADGTLWLDLLVEHPPVPFGTRLPVQLAWGTVSPIPPI